MNLDEDDDLNEALDMLCPPSLCDPALHFINSATHSIPFSSQHDPRDALPQQPTGSHQLAALSSFQDAEDASEKTTRQKRRVGRPRVDEPGGSGGGNSWGANAAAACGGSEGKRGPKPKYVFETTDEALDARRGRNRKAALESYYKKRQKLESLEEEKERLLAENAALEKLLSGLKEGTTMLSEPSDNAINTWLQSNSS